MVRWETWTPSDPATLAELKEREEEEDQKRSKEFEESNPDFCKQMVDDMKSRSEARRVPCTINGGCRVATGCLLPTTAFCWWALPEMASPQYSRVASYVVKR